MADIVRVDDQVIKVQIEKHGEKYRVLLNGESQEVQVAGRRGSHLTLIVNDRPFDIVYANDGDIVVNNQTYRVQIFDEQVAKLMKADTGRSGKRELIMTAAMPGLIIDVSVKEGDRVIEGQGLIIIEAMKMQNEIQSTRDGIVRKINVKKGQTVNSGEKLITIE